MTERRNIPRFRATLSALCGHGGLQVCKVERRAVFGSPGGWRPGSTWTAGAPAAQHNKTRQTANEPIIANNVSKKTWRHAVASAAPSPAEAVLLVHILLRVVSQYN